MAHSIEITPVDDRTPLLQQTSEDKIEDGREVDDLDEMKATNCQDRSVLQTKKCLNQIFHERFENLGNSSINSCCIFKVNVGLRESNPDAYTPKMISIGPYHKKNPKLFSMEKYKLFYLQRFLKRNEGIIDVEYCIRELEKLKDEALKCYDDTDSDIDVGKFSEMLLVDGCFVVEYIRELCRIEDVDPIIKSGCIDNQVRRDLLLLENQLPFFVLTKLHGMTKNEEEKIPFTNMVKIAFSCSLPKLIPASLLKIEDDVENIKHLLQVVHMSCHPSKGKTPPPGTPSRKTTPPGISTTPPGTPGIPSTPPSPPPSKPPTPPGTPRIPSTPPSLPSTPPSPPPSKPPTPPGTPSRTPTPPGTPISILPGTPSRAPRPLGTPTPPRSPMISAKARLKIGWENFPKDKDRVTILREDDMPSAAELCEAGVKFSKVGKIHKYFLRGDDLEDSTSLFDIRFENGRMEIPCFKVDDGTETVLRNLIAYEQHSPDITPKYFSDFEIFMDRLIDSGKDVNLLRQKGIINNCLGEDNDVASLFNKLGRGVANSSNFYYKYDCRKAVQHCEKPWNRMKASLRRNYFHTPWAGISTVAAVILLSLTFIQTVLAFLSVLK